MELQDNIFKVLTALSKDAGLQKDLTEKPEETIKGIVGSDVDAKDLAGLVAGTGKLFENKDIATGFMGLLGVEEAIPGMARLFTKKGGISILKKYINKANTGSGTPIRALGILTELLGDNNGTETLIRLIGSKQENLPDLNAMLAVMAGSKGLNQKPSKPAKKTETDNLIEAIGAIFAPDPHFN